MVKWIQKNILSVNGIGHLFLFSQMQFLLFLYFISLRGWMLQSVFPRLIYPSFQLNSQRELTLFQLYLGNWIPRGSCYFRKHLYVWLWLLWDSRCFWYQSSSSCWTAELLYSLFRATIWSCFLLTLDCIINWLISSLLSD